MNLFKIEAGIAQHIGNRPQQNDRVAVLTSARAPGHVLALLSDGAGNAAAAEQVLHTARQLFDEYKPSDTANPERLAQLLRDIVHETHLIIRMQATATGEENQASFVGLLLSPHGEAVWGHVGDSRLYRFENGEPRLRTDDKAYIEHLVGTDKLPLEAARHHRRSKLLANALGNSRKEPFVTIGWQMGMAPGDQFLLCSDGLWHFFTDNELGAAITRATPRQASERLIGKATERSQEKGGNCSLAILKLTKPVPEVLPTFAHGG